MVLKEVIEQMQRKPYLIRMGKGKLSKRFNCDPDDILKARLFLKNNKKEKIKKMPKILIFDIETAPMKAYVWKRWKENISLEQTLSEWFMLCWSAKWLYSNEIMGDVLTPEEVKNEDDFRIVSNLWDLIDEADIVVAHNGDKFDIPRINSRFIVNGLPPTKPFFSVDTCKVAKKQFGFSSNKLDALATYFNFNHKLETSFDLWKDCMNGDKKALEYMLKYNKQDVNLLEEVYLKLRPWIKGHPNCGNLISSELPVCSICASKKLRLLEGQYYYTSIGKYELYYCEDCGAISRGRVNLNKGINQITSVGK